VGKTIAITGVNGYVASTLLPLLEAAKDIDKIIGIDVRPWKGGFSKVEFFREDVRNPGISALLEHADTVCHFSSAGEAVHNAQCRGCGRCERFCPEKAVTITIKNPGYADEVKERIRSYVSF
jgi:ferredoxin